jgi:hypothetical protein
MSSDDATVALFLSIGLKDAPAKELVRNKKKSKILVDVIHEVCLTDIQNAFHFVCSLSHFFVQAGVSGGCEDVIGTLLLNVATSLSESSWSQRPTLLKYVVDRRIANAPQVNSFFVCWSIPFFCIVFISFSFSIDQLDAAYKYLKSHDAIEDVAEFERACGVGISFTADQIKAAVASNIEARRAELVAERYTVVPAVFVTIKQQLEWGDARAIKEEVPIYSSLFTIERVYNLLINSVRCAHSGAVWPED